MKLLNFLRVLLGLKSKSEHSHDVEVVLRRMRERKKFKDDELGKPIEYTKPVVFSPVLTEIIPKEVKPEFPYAHTPFFTYWSRYGANNGHQFKTGYVPPKNLRTVHNWRTENQIAAGHILDRFPDGVTLVLDDTYASVIMSIAFKDAGADATKINQLHITDDEHITFMHVNLGVTDKPKFNMLGKKSFWNKEAINLAYSDHHVCDSVEVKRLWSSMIAKGTLVFPGGLSQVQRPFTLSGNDTDGWMVGDGEQQIITERFIRQHNKEVIPAFFRYTLEQVGAHLALVPAKLDEHHKIMLRGSEHLVYGELYPEASFEDHRSDEANLFEAKMWGPNIRYTSVWWQHIKPLP